MRLVRSFAFLSSATVSLALLAGACGGGVDEPQSCTVGEETFNDGEVVFDGCGECICEDGEVTCPLVGCWPAGSCFSQGEVYENGETFYDEDGCNSCTCEDGSLSCTDRACEDAQCKLPLANDGGCEAAIPRFWHNPETGVCEEFTYGGCGGNANNFETLEECQSTCAAPTCTQDGVTYDDGQPVPSGDCNTCTCSAGTIQCTLIDCGPGDICELPLANDGPCDGAIPRYFHNAETGKCEEFTYGGCGGNENNFESLAKCEATCGQEPTGISCQVGEEVYPDGASNVPDPMSCNTCACDNGEVTGCTEIDCPEECPDGTAFGRDCTECGPTDACLVQRSGCLPECDSQDDCLENGGVCLDGLCKNVCG